MVTITHCVEVEFECEGSSEDGFSVDRFRLVLGRDKVKNEWIHSNWRDLSQNMEVLIADYCEAEIMDAIRDAEANQASDKADAKAQKADDRWSERGLRCE